MSNRVLVVLLGNASWPDGFGTSLLPNFQRVQQAGTTFPHWIGNTIGSQTTYALIHGRYPFRNGNPAGFNWYSGTTQGPSGYPTPSVPTSTPSIGHALKVAGWHTAWFGKWNVGRHDDRLDPLAGQRNGYTPHLSGFDVWRAGIGSNVNAPQSQNAPGSAYDDWPRWDNARMAMSSQWCDVAIADEWLAWNAQATGDRFSIVSFQANHGPLSFPPAYALPPGYISSTPAQDTLVAADHQLGRILDELDLETDYVLVMATCGSGPKSVRDDRILCPAAASGPWAGPPGATGHEQLGTPRDFSAHLNMMFPKVGTVGQDSRRDAEYAYCEWHGKTTPQSPDVAHKAVRTLTHKLTDVGGLEQLWDLVEDPNELSPIDPDDYGDAAMVAQLRGWMANP